MTWRGAKASVSVAVALGLAACGSTVDLAPSHGEAAAVADGLPRGSVEQTARVPATTSIDRRAVSTPAATDDASGAAVPQGLPRVAGSGQLDGPGVTASTITFGVKYATDTGAVNASLGAGAVDPGDIRDYYDALVDDVNRSGGVAGRRLVPAYYLSQGQSSESADSRWTAACEHFAYDVKAFVFLGANSEVARSCAEKHGMLVLGDGGSAVRETFRRYPHYLEPSGVALEDYEAATIAGLGQTDYFGKAPVVGIVTWDDAARHAAVAVVVKQLAKLGLKARVVTYLRVPPTEQEAGPTLADLGSAVLRFQQEGVDHALLLDGPAGACLGTCITTFWLQAARSQRYYPRYGFNDLNSPQAGMDLGLWGPDDVRGARALTVLDATDAADVGVTRNRARVACFAVMRQHGLLTDNAEAKGAMLRACENIWFLRAVLGTARLPVNRDRFVALVNGLGSAYQSPLVYRTRFSPARHAGVAGYRRMALDDGCGCFVYTSGVYEP